MPRLLLTLVAVLAVVLVGAASVRSAHVPVVANTDPVISPGGESIAYWRDVGGARRASLIVMRASGAQKRRIATAVGRQAAWSPDSGLIAFALNWTPNTIGGHTSVICGVDLRGNAYRLTSVDDGTEMEQPSWSPGGARFAVVNGPVTGPYPPNFAIWALGTLGRVVAVGARNSEWPSWAPHGDAIAYQTPADSMAGGGLTPAIWVAHADGTGAHNVAPGRGRASWAPDGSAFALPSDGGIKIVSAEGTAKQTLLQGSYVPWVSWSPGGSTLLFQQGLNTEAAFQLMAVDGSHRRTIRPRVTGFTPVWSPSGRMIAYQTDDAIRVVNADGSHQRRLFGGTFIPGGGLSWQPVPQPALLKKLSPCLPR